MAMARPFYLVDTCSFVQQFSDPACAGLVDELIVKGRFVLSAIVAMELYAGTKDRQAKRALDTLGLRLREVGLLVTPDYSDYQKAGMILRNYSKRKGAIKSSTHFRDILICLGALRTHAVVVSENRSDFLRWSAELKRMFRKDLTIQSWSDLI